MESKYSKKYLIETGSGLQKVDGLNNSTYFKNESIRYLNGEISLAQFDETINNYYVNKANRNEESEEADKVALRISTLLADDSFSFTIGQLLSIHGYLFKGIIKNAGKLRNYNLSKKEWVLDNDSVSYGDYRQLRETLEYDFNIEKNFNYKGLNIDEIIEHLAIFISNLWQIHAFEEGNTRTTAVFVIKYLRKLGFEVTNDCFGKNAWYFRNALVRANYVNLKKGIVEERKYLILFLRNLLLDENNQLNNRDLHIKNEVLNNKVKSRETRIIELMKTNPQIKLEDIADKLQISLRTVKIMVATLKEKKLITRLNGKKYGYWQVTTEEKK